MRNKELKCRCGSTNVVVVRDYGEKGKLVKCLSCGKYFRA